MTIKDMIERRTELAKRRDEIQQEIVELWQTIQAAVCKQIEDLGAFQRQWKLSEDLSYSSDTKPLTLVMSDQAICKQACEISKLHNSLAHSVEIEKGVRLRLNDCSMVLTFDHDCNHMRFINSRGIKVDFSYFDAKINQIEALKREWV